MSKATEYVVTDGPKMLRETLCVAQAALGRAFPNDPRLRGHLDRLGRLIAECDRHRPIASNGKHGDLHTATCGCDAEQAELRDTLTRVLDSLSAITANVRDLEAKVARVEAVANDEFGFTYDAIRAALAGPRTTS